MKISEAMRNRVKGYEGYHRALKNGDCTAYRCPAGVWTIGWGSTEGVREGLVWSRDEAEAALTRELAKFETGVDRLVTVDMNQNEFDALVSFAYNVGLGALGSSTLLKKLNKGDRAGAAKEFAKWTRGGGRVLPGLVSRRASEAALFVKPVAAPDEPFMPQSVEASKEPMSAPTAAVSTSAVVGPAAAVTTASMLPAPPDAVTSTVSNVDMWRTLGETVSGLANLAVAKPLLAAAVVTAIFGFIFGPLLKSYLPKITWGAKS